MNVHKAKFTMPAGLPNDYAEVTSSNGDVERHLLCRGGMFFMNGSPQYCHNVSLKKGLICFIYPYTHC